MYPSTVTTGELQRSSFAAAADEEKVDEEKTNDEDDLEKIFSSFLQVEISAFTDVCLIVNLIFLPTAVTGSHRLPHIGEATVDAELVLHKSSNDSTATAAGFDAAAAVCFVAAAVCFDAAAVCFVAAVCFDAAAAVCFAAAAVCFVAAAAGSDDGDGGAAEDEENSKREDCLSVSAAPASRAL